MKVKIIGIITFMMLIIIAVAPIAIGGNNDLETSKSDPTVLPLMRGIVFGFFPRVSGDEITFLSFPSFQWGTISKEEFHGYIGIFIIYGYTGGPL